MKIAVSGKGGAGKTTVAALLARALEAAGRDVLAVDADPNATLAYALGLHEPEGITPLAEMEDLIREKTGAEKGRYGAYFRMNPEVSDIPERFKLVSGRVSLLVMGVPARGGAGCACPEYVLIKNLIGHLLLNGTEEMLIDMEAGLEHLARGVTEKVDALLVVLRPDRASCLTASRISDLAGDLRIRRVLGIGNAVRSQRDKTYIAKTAADIDILGFIPWCDEVQEYERKGKAAFEIPRMREGIEDIIGKIVEVAHA